VWIICECSGKAVAGWMMLCERSVCLGIAILVSPPLWRVLTPDRAGSLHGR
jgi:hypothetical protein